MVVSCIVDVVDASVVIAIVVLKHKRIRFKKKVKNEDYIDVDAFVVSVVIAPVAVIVCDVVSFSVVAVVPAVVSSS